MKKKINIFYSTTCFCLGIFMFQVSSCENIGIMQKTVYVHDTIRVLAEGEFTYNLPCKVVNIHQEKEGKSILFIWLHGGVYDRKLHDFSGFNHLNCTNADDNILKYLQGKGIKSIALFPICHKAVQANCVTWKNCFNDINCMIDDYVNKGIVDPRCVYLAGSSDGGLGTWDYLEEHSDLFAAAMPMSCDNPRKTSTPVYFFNTKSESDCTEQVCSLNMLGCKIEYKHCIQYKHGEDGAECTPKLLDRFFSTIKQ